MWTLQMLNMNHLTMLLPYKKNNVSILICKALKVGSKQVLMSQCVSLGLMIISFRGFFVKNHLFHKNEFFTIFYLAYLLLPQYVTCFVLIILI